MSWLQKIMGRRKSIEAYMSRNSGSRRGLKRPVSKLRVEALETRTLLAGLWTDLSDYAPGTMATLYGEGFRPGEAVDFRIVSSTGGIGAKFTLVDGGVRDADGAANGAFATSWYVDESNADAHLTAMATGQLSGEVAVAKFTDSGKDSPTNISVANGWTPGGSNGRNPVTTVTCAADKTITQVSIKTGNGGGFVIENLTGIPGDQNTGSTHSPVIVKDGYLGKGNAFSTTPPPSGPYYAVSGMGTATVTIAAVNGAEQLGGGISHVDYFCDDVPVFEDPVTIEGRKFNDLNGNGVYDTNEPGIAGWPIVITIGGNTTSLVTQANGSYSATFTVSDAELAAGIPYHVQESLLAGWTQTYGMAGYSGTFTQQDEVVSNADFGHFKNFEIDGIKFEDHDGDGVQDPEDHGLADWTILLDGPNGLVTATTEADGRYHFDDLGPGSYTVVEQLQAGWTQTYGNAGYTIVGSSGSDSIGNNFGNFHNFDIRGMKFEDHDGDGFQDPEDHGLADWTIALSGPSGIVTATTDADGRYHFDDLGPGSYLLMEALQAEWTQTYGKAGYTIVGSSGSDSSGNDFGHFKNFDIDGMKFEDHDGDGFQDPEDHGLADWTIVLSGPNGMVTATTDADGLYRFDDLGPGTYSVVERLQAGWTQTYGKTGYSIVGSSGSDSSGNDFGNFKNFDIDGMKFEDHDGDGFQDPEDHGLADWTIVLSGPNGMVTATTDADGRYRFDDLGPGTYSVVEQLQAGWTQTYGKAGYSIVASSGVDSDGNDFGNFKNISIGGMKFVDHNGNGMRESGDQGFANWTIILKGPTGFVTATTDANGHYRFDHLGPGTYQVLEQQQKGWTRTYGNGGYSIIAASGIDYSGRDFGNFKNITISGVKFYDANANSVRNTNEPGINGWTFGLDVNGDSVPDITTVTSGSGASGGSFSFGNLGPGSYTVYELNGLSGNWLPTTATVSGTLVATSGVDQHAGDFGNVKIGASGGLALGFWSNKNGQNTMNAGPGGMAGALSMLSGRNLRNANGSDFNPTSYTQFRTWLLNANSTNMSYMLSAHLAAMSLNVFVGKVSGTALVYAPNTNSANAIGFATVNALLSEANTALGSDGYTPSCDANRGYQERLKNALDKANNNLNFVLPRSVWFDANGNGVIDAGEI